MTLTFQLTPIISPLPPSHMASNCNNGGDDFWPNDKFVLEPREASLLDILLLLVSPDIKSRRFVKCKEEHKHEDFKDRWLIFISILLQKVLLYARQPMARIGNALEMWLNLLSSNGGFFMMLLNLLTGRTERPDRSSATFTSVVGNIDLRVELDRNIRLGDRRYNISLSMMAAKLSYESAALIESVVNNRWNMKFLRFYDCWNEHLQRSSTQAFILEDTESDPSLIAVAFRGTEPFDADDWMADVDLSWYELAGVGKIHGGFMHALGLQKDGWPKDIEPDSNHMYAYYAIRQTLRDMLNENEKAKFIVTGHSLGGALAVLFVGVLALHEETLLLERLEGVYTFGQPRVGDRQFGEFMVDKLQKYDVKYLRYVYCNDMVPRLPYDDSSLLYKHFGPCLYYNSCYKGKVLWEEPNKNYFSLLWALPMALNAVWELIRGFIIPFIKGEDYREGWFMKVLRLIGLAIPGLSAHSPQDYDNCTRLGSFPSPLQHQDLHQELHQD